MSEYLERNYTIGGRGYWEDDLNYTVYHLDGNLYTQKQLESISESWSIFYNINGLRFHRVSLEEILPRMGPGPNSTDNTYGLTRQQIERALSLTETPALATTPTTDPPKPPQPDDDSRSEITQPTFSNEGIETPPAHENEEGGEDEGDELIAKVLANLQAKMQTVKQHKKLAAEVGKLRKLLADKEAKLVESEKIFALEVGQVKDD